MVNGVQELKRFFRVLKAVENVFKKFCTVLTVKVKRSLGKDELLDEI